VTSTVDRFLEHARIFFFEAGGKNEVYLSSADWMPRNFVRRIEVMFPIDDPVLRKRIIDEILATQLADNVRARRLLPDGTYQRVVPEKDATRVRSQERFVALARKKSQESATPRAQEGASASGPTFLKVKSAPPHSAEATLRSSITPPPIVVS
jgi:polyphosphate kinase